MEHKEKLNLFTVKQLKQVIRKYNLHYHISKYSSKKKNDLIDIILKHMNYLEDNFTNNIGEFVYKFVADTEKKIKKKIENEEEVKGIKIKVKPKKGLKNLVPQERDAKDDLNLDLLEQFRDDAKGIKIKVKQKNKKKDEDKEMYLDIKPKKINKNIVILEDEKKEKVKEDKPIVNKKLEQLWDTLSVKDKDDYAKNFENFISNLRKEKKEFILENITLKYEPKSITPELGKKLNTIATVVFYDLCELFNIKPVFKKEIENDKGIDRAPERTVSLIFNESKDKDDKTYNFTKITERKKNVASIYLTISY